MFNNRDEAGGLLAERLLDYQNQEDVVVVAVPRGGVPVGAVIAAKLKKPLEIVLSKKIGHPLNKEYAIGAVTLENKILSPAADDISENYIEEETERIRVLLKTRYQRYFGEKEPLKLSGKIIILVDDGVATGNTMLSCIELIQQQHPSKIIVALPVAPDAALIKIGNSPYVNKILCLLTPSNFMAVGQFYTNFTQVSDEEVIQLLKNSNL